MELPVIAPMAALAVDDEAKMSALWDNPSYIAERKFDGCRYLMYIQPEKHLHRFFSRRESAKDGKPVEKTSNVPHLNTIDFSKRLTGLTILDGEIITPNAETSSEVVKIMGADPEKAIARQEAGGWVHYVVFDILYHNGESVMEKPWYARRELLESLFMDGLLGHEYLHITAVTQEGKEEMYRDIVAEGGEGVILKNIFAPYHPGKRPANVWVKAKKYSTFDVVITGFDPPEMEYKGKLKEMQDWPYWAALQDGEWHRTSPGKVRMLRETGTLNETVKPVTKLWYNGWVGAIRFGQCVNGELVEIGTTSGMTDEERHFFTQEGDRLIGTVIEVGAMERIKGSNALRHPRYLRMRDDKQAHECIVGEC